MRMRVGLAVRKGEPDVGVIVNDLGKVVHSNFSFGDGLEKLLKKLVNKNGWVHDEVINGSAVKILKRGVKEKDLDWFQVKEKSRQVLKALMKVGRGKTITYGKLAEKCGTKPRAVGQIVHRNPFAPFVPCHRVIAKNGPGGFAGGLETKLKMLKREGVKY